MLLIFHRIYDVSSNKIINNHPTGICIVPADVIIKPCAKQSEYISGLTTLFKYIMKCQAPTETITVQPAEKQSNISSDKI